MKNKTACEVGVNKVEYSNVLKCHENYKKIILVEADPECCKNLRSFVENDEVLKSKTVIFECAVWFESGKVELVNKFPMCQSSFIKTLKNSPMKNRIGVSESSKIKTISVPALTFNEIDDGEIDLLYIDVEGAEFAVLKHLISRPTTIQIELKNKNTGYVNPFYDSILQWMEENGYIKVKEIVPDCIFQKIP